MSTEDLLFMLAMFGRNTPADICDAQQSEEPTGGLNPVDAQAAREYLYCTLRDNLQSSIDQVQQTCDANLASAAQEVEEAQGLSQGECDAALTCLQTECPGDPTVEFTCIEGAVENAVTEISEIHNMVLDVALAAQNASATAQIAALRAEMAAQAAAYEAQLAQFHCAHITLPNGEVTGETTSGGSGVVFSCHDGYELVGAQAASCLETGAWSVATPTCNLVNPCTADEDDCVPQASCAHTGPATHTCECNDGFFGDGVNGCSECGSCPFDANGISWPMASPCTSTTDIVCLDPCLSITCGDYGSCVGGQCVCIDGYTGASCEVAPPPEWVVVLREQRGSGGYSAGIEGLLKSLAPQAPPPPHIRIRLEWCDTVTLVQHNCYTKLICL